VQDDEPLADHDPTAHAVHVEIEIAPITELHVPALHLLQMRSAVEVAAVA
jgi:hypothetical protein